MAVYIVYLFCVTREIHAPFFRMVILWVTIASFEAELCTGRISSSLIWSTSKVRRGRKGNKTEPKTIYLATEELVSFPFLGNFIKMCECSFFPRVSVCLFIVTMKQTSWSYGKQCRSCGWRCPEKQIKGIHLFIYIQMFCQIQASLREMHSSLECFLRGT